MSTPSHPTPRDSLTLERRLSTEETYALVHTAQRKSSSEISRKDLRMRIGHSNVLELLLHDLALTESENPAQREGPKQQNQRSDKRVGWAPVEVSKTSRYVNEADAEYDDGEEDLEGLSLVRTQSQRPRR